MVCRFHRRECYLVTAGTQTAAPFGPFALIPHLAAEMAKLAFRVSDRATANDGRKAGRQQSAVTRLF